MTSEQQALLQLGQALRETGYDFVSVTPETHRRILERRTRTQLAEARDLRDVFGWNLPFQPQLLSRPMLEWLETAGALERSGDRLRSRVRFSNVAGDLYVHSAFPTSGVDAVFFGPDTYRFCALLKRWAPATCERALDIGCGSGAGGLSLAERVRELILSDVNPAALQLAAVNAALAKRAAQCILSDVMASVSGQFDLIIANPPYMRDNGARLYRDGGGQHGEALSVRIVREALPRLAPGGTLILYTGSAIVDGVDSLKRAVLPFTQAHAARVDYEELDPDVFGDELDQPGYENVERLAAVGLRICVGNASC